MFRTIVLIALFLKWLTDIPPAEDIRHPASVDVVAVADQVSDAGADNHTIFLGDPLDVAGSRSGNYD